MAIAISKGEADPSTYRVHIPTRDASGRWFMREATLEEKHLLRPANAQRLFESIADADAGEFVQNVEGKDQ